MNLFFSSVRLAFVGTLQQQYNAMLISTARRGMPAAAAADHCIEMLFWQEPKVSAPPASLAYVQPARRRLCC